MAAKSEKAIRESLMTQLRAKGADVSHFEGLVDDYVEYFRLVKKMKADIKKRGLSYTATSAAGKVRERQPEREAVTAVHQGNADDPERPGTNDG